MNVSETIMAGWNLCVQVGWSSGSQQWSAAVVCCILTFRHCVWVECSFTPE